MTKYKLIHDKLILKYRKIYILEGSLKRKQNKIK